MKAIIIDPRQAGCSGDMFLSSLVDLLEGEKILHKLIKTINQVLEVEIKLDYSKNTRKGISSTYLDIKISRDIDSHHALDIQELIDKLLNKLSLKEITKNKIIETLNSLLKAESSVHQEPIEKLHLHETASVDTILDIVGFYFLLEKKGLENMPIYGLPANVGSGTVTFSHGTVTVPAPAVLEIMKEKNYPFFSDDVKGELVTPTGAIILTNSVDKVIHSFPPMKLVKIGKGVGFKELENRANILSIFLVEIPEDHSKHHISMLETHLDDVSGEIMGDIISKLMKKGALDVAYYPLIMKKNRPGWNLRVLCEPENTAKLAEHIMRELGTLGVRENSLARYELERRVTEKNVTIDSKKFTCKYKERLYNGKVIGAKPEFEDIKRISKVTKTPLIQLEKELIRQYKEGER